MPFGGVKQSGFGKDMGSYALEECVHPLHSKLASDDRVPGIPSSRPYMSTSTCKHDLVVRSIWDDSDMDFAHLPREVSHMRRTEATQYVSSGICTYAWSRYMTACLPPVLVWAARR